MAQSDPVSVDAEIAAALARARDEDWKALWDAVDVLAGETTFATWSGGEGETHVPDGGRPPR